MAFAVHIHMERCTGCNNCVVACPVDALTLHTVDPASEEKIYVVRDGRSVILDSRGKLPAGCGIGIRANPYGLIRFAGPRESRMAASVQ
jgi:4Fe-4S ferredoxin